MNGYGAWSNQQSVDYRQKNFLGSAFTASEQAAIISTLLENTDNLSYGTEGGNNTTDKIFLLSESNVWNSDTAKAHGFVKDYNTHDEARRCQSSAYAKAMGMYSRTDTAYAGNGLWWMRSPGGLVHYAMYVGNDGWVNRIGNYVDNYYYGVRSALYLNLSSSNLYTYAGTVRSDGTISENNKTYLVSFEGNGGDCNTSAKEVVFGSTYGALLTPTRSGYTFAGWYSGDSQVTETTKVSYSVLHVLYAHWKKDGSTVQKPSVPLNPSVSPTPSVDLKAVARKNHAITVSSGDLSLKSATGITEADKYLSLGKIQMGAKRFTLKLKVDGVSRITYKSSSKKTASISSKGVVKIKGVGQTTITVTGTLNSTGKKITKKYTLTVNPDRPALKEVRAVGDRKMRFSWKKCKRGDGCELWYSLSKTFKKNTKGRTIPKTGNTIGTLTGLISGAKYYVKVRTYKVVSGKVYYSDWSKTKSVTIK